jgi:valyl-tRNA synthetase
MDPKTTALPLPKAYEPREVEEQLYGQWLEGGGFKPAGEGAPYCILLPPPNVTGTLHMGHAFQDTLMDILIRRARMDGACTLWQTGTDHAGIATQMVVERELEKEGLNRITLGREAFLKRVWAWKEVSGGTILRQMKRLGCSADWARERFTLDPAMSRAVAQVFIRLHDEGLIYRGLRLVNWDPQLETALSDLEVRAEEETGTLWYLRYPRTDGHSAVVVATTRPETLFGDVALAVHPEDTRYHDLVGQQVWLPTGGRKIPVIADPFVDPAFGTGCVKITPAHDFNDFAVWERLHVKNALPLFRILDSRGRLTEPAQAAREATSREPLYWLPPGLDWEAPELGRGRLIPDAYRGLDCLKARERLMDELKTLGRVEKTEPHRLSIPRGDRSGAIIEPMLTRQWFVQTRPLAERAIQAVEKGDIRFVPENWTQNFLDWLHHIQDWCISRQLWWGHRIPAWYDDRGQWYVGHDEADVRHRHALDPDCSLHQDPDVLDTWFSSALWPFATLGWPEDTPALQTFYPTAVLVTGFDIIFFWVARMVMMGLHVMDEVPFRTVYVHALVRDAEGQKMSKSKGNVLDPLDLIDGIDLETLIRKRTHGLLLSNQAQKIATQTRKEYPQGIPAFGTDALRFTFTALAAPGRDLRFDLKRVAGYRNFCNKLWNAGRLIQQLGGQPVPFTPASQVWNRWIRSRLASICAAAEAALDSYRFDELATHLYEFTWNEFCDWYLEIAKNHLAPGSGDEATRSETRSTLKETYSAILRLLHPVIPFITEELWGRLAWLHPEAPGLILNAPSPHPVPEDLDPALEQGVQRLQELVMAIRRTRSAYRIADAKRLKAAFVMTTTDAAEARIIRGEIASIRLLARLENCEEIPVGSPKPAGSATLVTPSVTLWLTLTGHIDREAETARLRKEFENASRQKIQVQARLQNSAFRDRAPQSLIEAEQARLATLDLHCGELVRQLEELNRLE